MRRLVSAFTHFRVELLPRKFIEIFDLVGVPRVSDFMPDIDVLGGRRTLRELIVEELKTRARVTVSAELRGNDKSRDLLSTTFPVLRHCDAIQPGVTHRHYQDRGSDSMKTNHIVSRPRIAYEGCLVDIKSLHDRYARTIWISMKFAEFLVAMPLRELQRNIRLP